MPVDWCSENRIGIFIGCHFESRSSCVIPHVRQNRTCTILFHDRIVHLIGLDVFNVHNKNHGVLLYSDWDLVVMYT